MKAVVSVIGKDKIGILAMIANVTIIGKNILQDINGKHVPLAAN